MIDDSINVNAAINTTSINNDDDLCYSRIKEDLIHQCQDIPLSRRYSSKAAALKLFKQDCKALIEILRLKGIIDF